MTEPPPSSADDLPCSRDEFDGGAYLALHPDVAEAVRQGVTGSAWQHFVLHGCREGRRWVAKPNRMSGVNAEISPADEMFAGDRDHYFDAGESALHCITRALDLAGRRPEQVGSMLDLPCGHGRVLRFLRQAFPAASLTACDLDRDGVDFCARTFGAVPVPSDTDPEHIRFPSPASFDLIWCGSLLTHLSLPDCRKFLRSFARWLAPGGLLVVTVHGDSYARQLAGGRRTIDLDAAQTAELLAQYRRSGFGYVDYGGQTGYGFSVVHPDFVRAGLLPDGDWTLLDHHQKGWDFRQDVLTLRRS